MNVLIILGSPWLSEGVRPAFGGGAPCNWRGCTLQLKGVGPATGGSAPCNWRGCTLQLEGVHRVIGGGCTLQLDEVHCAIGGGAIGEVWRGAFEISVQCNFGGVYCATRGGVVIHFNSKIGCVSNFTQKR